MWMVTYLAQLHPLIGIAYLCSQLRTLHIMLLFRSAEEILGYGGVIARNWRGLVVFYLVTVRAITLIHIWTCLTI
jgi:hypothetical protein